MRELFFKKINPGFSMVSTVNRINNNNNNNR